MKPSSKFADEVPEFWALVRFASEQVGYSKRSREGETEKSLLRYEKDEIQDVSKGLGVDKDVIDRVTNYMNHRSETLENNVRDKLMNKKEAERVFKQVKAAYKPTCQLPFNKQKGSKRHPAYFTCIINSLTQHHLNGRSFVDNPRRLATIKDKGGKLIKTLSRQIDGAYPTLVDPIAVWEVKEYYDTTTFGSRVADGVYETQLDGYEILEAEAIASRRVEHYLFVDDRYTWWDCGRSYLCRLVDAMHMGLVDEVIFGKEVLERWPEIVKSWP